VEGTAINPEEDNSGLEVYYQLGELTLEGCALADMLHQVMNEPCFDMLRTKQQLGYIVDCGTRNTCSVSGFCFVVKTPKVSPAVAEARVEAFVRHFHTILGEMSTAAFEEHRTALIAEKLEKDDALSDEAWRHWMEISDARHCFDRAQREARQIKGITLPQLAEWYKANFLDAAKRRLVVHVQSSHPPSGAESGAEADGGPVQIVQDAASWHETASYYRNAASISAEYAK